MVTDHQAAVSLFRREADRGGHAELKTFAGGKLPALEEHLRMARELAAGRTTLANSNANGNMHGNANSNLSGNTNANGNVNMNANTNRNANTNANGNVNRNANSNPPARR